MASVLTRYMSVNMKANNVIIFVILFLTFRELLF